MGIIKICRKCGGAGWRLVAVKPISFRPCSKCGGRKGRIARKEAPDADT